MSGVEPPKKAKLDKLRELAGQDVAYSLDGVRLKTDSPRVCQRDLCSNVKQLFDLGSSFHRKPALLLVAGTSRWHYVVVLSWTS